jgi:hypothetical protein
MRGTFHQQTLSASLAQNNSPTDILREHLLPVLPRAINSLHILSNNTALLRVLPMVPLPRRVTILPRSKAMASLLLLLSSSSRDTTGHLHLNHRLHMALHLPIMGIPSRRSHRNHMANLHPASNTLHSTARAMPLHLTARLTELQPVLQPVLPCTARPAHTAHPWAPQLPHR